MTGFGTAAGADGEFQVAVEIRSVNHRYLKIVSRMPEDFSWLAEEVEGRLRQRLGRGMLQVVVQASPCSQADHYELDAGLLTKLYREVREMAARLHPDEEVRLRDLLTLEGVVRPTVMTETERGPLARLVLETVDRALDGLRDMQAREGRHLQSELERLLSASQQHLARIVELLPEATRQNGDRYRKRLQDFLAATGVEVQPADVLREVAILAEKADVAEEVGRLQGHLEAYRRALTGGGAVGRKLDFLAQELLREANTMASKVNQLSLATLVVELKTEIDRLREQTQNIE